MRGTGDSVLAVRNSEHGVGRWRARRGGDERASGGAGRLPRGADIIRRGGCRGLPGGTLGRWGAHSGREGDLPCKEISRIIAIAIAVGVL